MYGETSPLVTSKFSSAAYLGRLFDQMDHAQISLRIREARKAAGYRSREDLADVMQVHPRTIENWENPKTSNVPYDRMEELSGVLNVEKRWLLHGDEQPRSGAEDQRLAQILDRLQALEDQVTESIDLTREMLQLLRETAPPTVAAPPRRKRASG